MSPGDIVDSFLYDPAISSQDSDALLRLLMGFVKELKPDQAHMPLSPLELAQLRGELENQARLIRLLLAAIGDAKARRPAHFRLVSKGGR